MMRLSTLATWASLVVAGFCLGVVQAEVPAGIPAPDAFLFVNPSKPGQCLTADENQRPVMEPCGPTDTTNHTFTLRWIDARRTKAQILSYSTRLCAGLEFVSFEGRGSYRMRLMGCRTARTDQQWFVEEGSRHLRSVKFPTQCASSASDAFATFFTALERCRSSNPFQIFARSPAPPIFMIQNPTVRRKCLAGNQGAQLGVILVDCDAASADQRFTFLRPSGVGAEGEGQVQVLSTGLCVGLKWVQYDTFPGSWQLAMAACNASLDQMWRSSSSGLLESSAHPGLCVTNPGRTDSVQFYSFLEACSVPNDDQIFLRVPSPQVFRLRQGAQCFEGSSARGARLGTCAASNGDQYLFARPKNQTDARSQLRVFGTSLCLALHSMKSDAVEIRACNARSTLQLWSFSSAGQVQSAGRVGFCLEGGRGGVVPRSVVVKRCLASRGAQVFTRDA